MSSGLDAILRMGRRTALIGALIETFEGKDRRLEAVRQLHANGILSDSATNLLLEVYGLEITE